MTERLLAADTPELRERWGNFAWTQGPQVRSLIFAMWAAVSTLASASEGGPKSVPVVRTGDAMVDGFFDDLAAGRIKQATARIGTIESLSGLPPQFKDRTEYVARVRSCVVTDVTPKPNGYRIAWNCPDGAFLQLIDPKYRAPKLTVTEFIRAGAVPTVTVPRPPRPTKRGN